MDLHDKDTAGEIERRQLLGAVTLALFPLGACASSASRRETRTTSGTRRLGDLEVSPIGLGCMGMTSGSYNPPRAADEMIPVIRGAFERGVTFFDTAEVYGPFTNEDLVGRALEPIRDEVVLASKFGFAFADGARSGRDARPESLRRAVEGMLRRLRTDRIDLVYLHRVDPEVPIEDVAGFAAQLIDEGKARAFGVSETSAADLWRAHAECRVSALQSQYSVFERVLEHGVLDACRELDVGVVPWGPVARGLLCDRFDEWSRFAPEHRLSELEAYGPEGLAANMDLLGVVRRWADAKGTSPAALSLSWLLAQSPRVVPIPGTTRLAHVEENLRALDVTWTADELRRFDGELTGVRTHGWRGVDSLERSL